MKAFRAALVGFAIASPAVAAPQAPAEISVRLDGVEGRRIELVVQVDLREGWKTYYKSAEGYQTEMALHWNEASADAVEGYEIQWPQYETFDFYGEPVRGYQEDVDFPILVTLKEGAELDSLGFTLEAYFCSNLCVREEIPYEIEISTHQLRLPWSG